MPEDWTNQELAELYRVEDALRKAGLNIDTDRGRTDEGEPWFLFCRPDTGDMIVHFAKIDGLFIAASAMSDRVLRGTDFRDLVDQVVATQPLVLPRDDNRKNGKPTKLFLHPSVMLTAFVATALLHAEQSDLLDFDEDVALADKTDLTAAVSRLSQPVNSAQNGSVRAETKAVNGGEGGLIQQLTGQVLAAVAIALALLEIRDAVDNNDDRSTKIAGDILINAEGDIIGQAETPEHRIIAQEDGLLQTEYGSQGNTVVEEVASHDRNAEKSGDDEAQAVEHAPDEAKIEADSPMMMVNSSPVEFGTTVELFRVDNSPILVNVPLANVDDLQNGLVNGNNTAVKIEFDVERLNLEEALARLGGDVKALVVELIDDAPVNIATVYSLEVDRDLDSFFPTDRISSSSVSSTDNPLDPGIALVANVPESAFPIEDDALPSYYDRSAEASLNWFMRQAVDLEMILVDDEVVFYDNGDIGREQLVVRSWELSDGSLISIVGLQSEVYQSVVV